jgi:hypothetical protein
MSTDSKERGGLYVINELRVDVSGAHPSKTAKGEAAQSEVARRWAIPLHPIRGMKGVVARLPCLLHKLCLY